MPWYDDGSRLGFGKAAAAGVKPISFVVVTTERWQRRRRGYTLQPHGHVQTPVRLLTVGIIGIRTINIAELKNTLSEQLRRVRKGETILIADRNQIVARLEPASEHEADDDHQLSVLEAKGILRRGAGPLTVSSLLDRPRVDVDILAALLAQRNEGR